MDFNLNKKAEIIGNYVNDRFFNSKKTVKIIDDFSYKNCATPVPENEILIFTSVEADGCIINPNFDAFFMVSDYSLMDINNKLLSLPSGIIQYISISEEKECHLSFLDINDSNKTKYLSLENLNK